MRIAYFVNQYPKVSHSFIRREIQSLETQGLEIIRISLRSDLNSLVDVQDREEFAKTHFILKQPIHVILFLVLKTFLLRPLKWLKSLILALKTGWHSETGIIWHALYFIEACVLFHWLQKYKIQHLHVHFGTNSTTIAMLAQELGGPSYSITIHGPEEFDKPIALSLGEKIQRSKFVVGISEFSKSQILRWIPYRHWKKAIVVHCGLDQSFYSGDIPPIPNTKRLVCVGRLCEQKGQMLLVRAMAELIAEGVEFELVLAGDGPMREDVEELVKEYNLSSHIRITGWINSQQVREEIVKARALVLPSFAEGLPVVIMEAMALKRPVISTYIAGIPELVIPGKTGWLVPASHISPLKQAIKDVLAATPDELQRLGDQGRDIVLQQHNIAQETKKLLKQFQLSLGLQPAE